MSTCRWDPQGKSAFSFGVDNTLYSVSHPSSQACRYRRRNWANQYIGLHSDTVGTAYIHWFLPHRILLQEKMEFRRLFCLKEQEAGMTGSDRIYSSSFSFKVKMFSFERWKINQTLSNCTNLCTQEDTGMWKCWFHLCNLIHADRAPKHSRWYPLHSWHQCSHADTHICIKGTGHNWSTNSLLFIWKKTAWMALEISVPVETNSIDAPNWIHTRIRLTLQDFFVTS